MLKIASIGDCCVDVYPKERKYFLGGTAFNRAKWLAQNGVKTSLVSAVGTDDWGQQYLTACKKLKINTDYLTILPGKTSHVDIILNQHQQPRFSAWNLGVLKNFTPKSLPQDQDAVIATCLTPIKTMVLFPNQTFKVVDFAGGSIYSPTLKTIAKYLPKIDLAVRSADQTELPHLKQLAKEFNKLILATLGKDGSILFAGQNEFRQPAIKTKTSDTTSAGDVFISAFVLTRSLKLATKAAARAITSPRS